MAAQGDLKTQMGRYPETAKQNRARNLSIVFPASRRMEMQGVTVTVERLNDGDVERLRAIRLRALADAPDAFGTTLEEALEFSLECREIQLRQLATLVAATSTGEVGMVRGSVHDSLADTGYLLSLWVAPETRRQGIASNLVDAVIQWGQEQRLKTLLLDVGELKVPAVAFYLQKGFSPNGIVGILPPPGITFEKFNWPGNSEAAAY